MKKSTIAALMISLLSLGGGTAMAKSYADAPQMNNQAPPCAPQADGQGNARPGYPCRPGMAQGGHGRGFGMLRMLNLTEKQQISIREIEKKYFGQSDSDRRHLWELKHELVKESLKKPSDHKRIDRLTESIGKQHTRLAHTESRLFSEVSTVLTPEQVESLMNMKAGPMQRPGFRN